MKSATDPLPDASEHPIAELRRIVEQQRELERKADVLVRAARNQGHSWESIANALGVSKQAAHKKFGK
ncbi:MAG TPA: AsnC family protein [Candidatus Agrococcus pullicola]|uniref:AsnC family protein n=1 Tax=Candidatus Agrococcus pullicola TaxID=2838429 RepID=A0A9D1YXI0_9MICO|nr:AsnC family protein [Candidatus Agrococcus pullicola]